jgi:hypothetical protein
VVAVVPDWDAARPVPKFELVVHHDYASGSTADLTGHENHGYRVAKGDDAESADRATFDGRSTRVVVFPSMTLTRLRGIRIRARVWLERLGDRRTIMEGYLAFAFVVDPDGALAAGVYTDSRWDEVRTPPGAVPLRRWVDVGFVYDGRDTAVLFLDGQVAASRYVPLGRVGSVEWPYGLNIGAWPDRDLRVFDGKIAEVWLWRLAR